jgi:branched-chain amino acid transport system substrate-binding protein
MMNPYLRAPIALVLAAIGTGANAQDTVRIGHVAPLTGAIAHLGKDSENGARLAIEEINASGLTIDGEKVTLQLDGQDDAGDPRTATQVAQKLVDDGAIGVVGHLNSGTSIPASRIYHEAGIVEISPSATNPTYTMQGFDNTYRVVATDAKQAPALAHFAAEALKIKSVAIVDDSTAYGQGLANQFEAVAKSLGIKVVSHDATTDKAIDFRAILTKVKGENPDAIMYGGMDATGGPLAKQARDLGLRARVFGGDGICSTTLPDLAGSAAGNVVCSEAGMALEKMPGGASFTAKYQARFHTPMQVYAPFSYDAVYVLVDAMKRAHSVDPKKIVGAMPATDYHGVIGDISFDAHGDLKHGAISMYTYQNGKKTLLKVESL